MKIILMTLVIFLSVNLSYAINGNSIISELKVSSINSFVPGFMSTLGNYIIIKDTIQLASEYTAKRKGGCELERSPTSCNHDEHNILKKGKRYSIIVNESFDGGVFIVADNFWEGPGEFVIRCSSLNSMNTVDQLEKSLKSKIQFK